MAILGKEVYRGTSTKGRQFLIRYPTIKDALIMTEYINTLSLERTFIRFQGEQVTLAEEQKYLDGLLKKIEDHTAVVLLLFCDEKLIGSSSIEMGDKIERHIGHFGISVAKEYRGEGIGSRFMEVVLQEARNYMPNLEIVSLGLFANNTLAKKMYEKFGFVQHGVLPHGVKLTNGYVDHLHMHKIIRPSDSEGLSSNSEGKPSESESKPQSSV